MGHDCVGTPGWEFPSVLMNLLVLLGCLPQCCRWSCKKLAVQSMGVMFCVCSAVSERRREERV